MKINNVPKYAEGLYIVARDVDGELWFWGAWENKDDAYKAAASFENAVVVNE